MQFDITLDYNWIQKKTNLIIPQVETPEELSVLCAQIFDWFVQATKELVAPHLKDDDITNRLKISVKKPRNKRKATELKKTLKKWKKQTSLPNLFLIY